MRKVFITLFLMIILGCGPDIYYEDTHKIAAGDYAVCQFSLMEGNGVNVDIEVDGDKKIDIFLTEDEGFNQFEDYFEMDTLREDNFTIDSGDHWLSIQNADTDQIQVFNMNADHDVDVFLLDRDNYNLYVSGQSFAGYGFTDTSELCFEIYLTSSDEEIFYVVDNTDVETPAHPSVDASVLIRKRHGISFLVFETGTGTEVGEMSYTFTAPKSIPYYIILYNCPWYENGDSVSVSVSVRRK